MQNLEDLRKAKVLVVGDVMLDRYWWGTVSRISPEAPVPIVRLRETSLAAGGAANVAANIAGLGATPFLFGVIGDDSEAGQMLKVLDEAKISADFLTRISGRATTVKTRVIAHSQQVARIDQETDGEVDETALNLLSDRFSGLIRDVDAVILSDYAKGFLTPVFVKKLIDIGRSAGKPVLVDPKGKNYEKYRGATVITPNRREAADACNLDENDPELVNHAGNRLMRDLSLEAALITLGEEGMTLFQNEKVPVKFPAAARKVYDVTGAGDTVIATLATAVGAGLSLEEAAKVANIAAGLVVEEVGTTSINLEKLSRAV